MFRYTIGELPAVYASGWFNTGDTVTIAVYDLSDGSGVPIDTAACTEISTTGQFRWAWSNITTDPTSLVEYVFVMDNGANESRDQVVFGGYPELVAPTGTESLTITVEELDTTPIGSVLINIMDNTDTVLIQSGQTNGSGIFTTNINLGDYKVRLTKNQVNFTTPEDMTILTGANTETYNGDVLTQPVSVPANTCKVYGTAYRQSGGSFLSSFDGTAKIKNVPFDINSGFYEGQSVAGQYDTGTGEFYWILPHNSLIVFNVKSLGIQGIQGQIPEESERSLASII